MVGVALMLAAALSNASASVLQRKASRDEDDSEQFSVRTLWHLAHRPAWVFGILTMLVGFLLHAVSISVTPISLVQPLLILELPLTLVLAAMAFHQAVGRREWVAIGMASAGVAAFVGSLAPHGGSAAGVEPLAWVIGLGATVVAVAALVIAGYRRHDEHRAVLLGVATGATFGLNSSLISAVGASVAQGHNLFLTWQTYAVAVVGPTSFFLLQNALSAGSLVASQPGFTLTNPLVAVVFGIVVFHQQTRQGVFVVVAAVGVALIAAGTIVLSRSRLLTDDAPDRRDASGEPS